VVGRGRHVEQLAYRVDVALSHLAFDLEPGHRRRVPVAGRCESYH
jgi:hypothetical protein